MLKNNKQIENLYTFLARKYYAEKTNESVHAGMRLVYRIIKAYDGKATKALIHQDVAKIVPTWQLARGVVSVDGCLSSLVRGGYIAKTGDTYAIVVKDNASGLANQVAN